MQTTIDHKSNTIVAFYSKQEIIDLIIQDINSQEYTDPITQDQYITISNLPETIEIAMVDNQ